MRMEQFSKLFPSMMMMLVSYYLRCSVMNFVGYQYQLEKKRQEKDEYIDYEDEDSDD